jgi:hypothetical protein
MVVLMDCNKLSVAQFSDVSKYIESKIQEIEEALIRNRDELSMNLKFIEDIKIAIHKGENLKLGFKESLKYLSSVVEK